MTKPLIPFSDFAKIEFRVGEVIECSAVEGSTKLLRLEVDFGPAFAKATAGEGTRTIYSGIHSWYTPESLVGRKFIFVVNLEPKKFVINSQELISEGMLLASGDGEAVLYTFDKDIPSGTLVR